MNNILNEIEKCGIIPVISLDNLDKAIPLARALYEADIKCLEITLRTSNACEIIEKITEEYDDIFIGAGTVLTINQAEKAIKSGAKFIVSPGLNEKVVNYCKEKNGDNYKLTVNSAPFAIDFYHKIGFKDTGKEQIVDGIKFLPMQLSIYKSKEYIDEYFDYLYQTKKECFKWYVEKIYGPWEDEFQVEFFKNFIREKRNYIKVIIYNDRPIGIFTNYINEDGDDFIGLFYIDKVYQGSGIGTQILKEQLLADKKSNIDTVLQVFKENPAKKLYEKVGFEVYDETDNHYKMIRRIKEE